MAWSDGRALRVAALLHTVNKDGRSRKPGEERRRSPRNLIHLLPCTSAPRCTKYRSAVPVCRFPDFPIFEIFPIRMHATRFPISRSATALPDAADGLTGLSAVLPPHSAERRAGAHRVSCSLNKRAGPCHNRIPRTHHARHRPHTYIRERAGGTPNTRPLLHSVSRRATPPDGESGRQERAGGTPDPHSCGVCARNLSQLAMSLLPPGEFLKMDETVDSGV